MKRVNISGVVFIDAQPSSGKPIAVNFEAVLSEDGNHHIVANNRTLSNEAESEIVRHSLEPIFLVAQTVFPERMKDEQ